MKIDLKDPFDYTKTKRCEAIEFRSPKGNEAQSVFALLSSLASLSEGRIPSDLAEKTLSFTAAFGSIVGDPDFPVSEVTQAITSRDIMQIADGAIANFI